MSHQKLASIAIVLLVIASPAGQALAQTIGTSAADPAVQYIEQQFQTGAIGQIIAWAVIVGIALLLWHVTHSGFLVVGVAVACAIVWFRAPQLSQGLMAAIGTGGAGTP